MELIWSCSHGHLSYLLFSLQQHHVKKNAQLLLYMDKHLQGIEMLLAYKFTSQSE